MSKEKNYYEVRMRVIDSLIILEKICDEILKSYFNKKVGHSTVTKLFKLGNLGVRKKALLVLHIINEYEGLGKTHDRLKQKIIECCEIRNTIAHKLPYSHYNKDIMNYSDPPSSEKANYFHKKSIKPLLHLAKTFDNSLIEITSLYLTYLDKLKEEEIFEKVSEDVVQVKVYLRNYKGWFIDITEIKLMDSEGDEYSLFEYPETNYPIKDFEKDVKDEVGDYLQNIKKIDLSKAFIEIFDELEYIAPND
ncbi:MAG: hypothetical protein V3V78_02325 [Candidatus Woesearchaeota archaeon]